MAALLTKFTVVEEDSKKKFLCEFCARTFTTLFFVKNHLQIYHSQEFICGTCNKKFQNGCQLRKHLAIHKLFDCPDCDGTFSKIELGYHRADAHGAPIPTCGVCGYRTLNKSQMMNHQRRVHMKERTIPCPFSQCDMMFYNQNHLRQHLVKHNPVKKFECKYCLKSYPRQNTLMRHERIHTGDKRKVCKICGEKFVQKASLNYHMMKRHPDAV